MWGKRAFRISLTIGAALAIYGGYLGAIGVCRMMVEEQMIAHLKLANWPVKVVVRLSPPQHVSNRRGVVPHRLLLGRFF